MVPIRKKVEDECLACDLDSPEYPWGTELTFHDDLADAVGIDSLNVGDVVEVRAYATVKSISKSKHESDQGGLSINKSMSLQLTEVELAGEKSPSTVAILYGE